MPAYSERGLVARLVQDIGRNIVSGRLAPGDTLDLGEIQTTLNVSRTVVREALKVLSAKGLTDARQRRGTFVREREHWALLDRDILSWRFAEPLDPQLLRDLNEVRLVIEPEGAAMAARRQLGPALPALRQALADLAHAQTPEGLTAADIAFHRQLLAASGNELLSQIDVVIEAGLRARDLLVFASDRATKDPDVPGHERVLDAVANGLPDEARAAMHELLRGAAADAELLIAARPKRATRRAQPQLFRG